MSKISEIELNPFQHPIVFKMPRRDLSSAWMEHVPFAFYMIDIAKPAVFVELGTFYGVSYCAFCQAVDELHLPTKCFAIDTWAGDPHMGPYDPDVLSSLRQHHDPLYSRFSALIQDTFDNAVERFANGTIDLLHIDGYHTYEAVKHDLETWKPKLSRRGVVIFHDTNERMGDFGVWKLFEELKVRHPSFEFLHGHGLGVVAVGDDIPSQLLPLFNLSNDYTELIRRFFFEMGQRVFLSTALAEKKQVEKALLDQIEHDVHKYRTELDLRSEVENDLRTEIVEKTQQLHDKESELQSSRQELESSRQELQSSQQELESIRVSRQELEKVLFELQQSLVVQLLTRYRVFIEWLLPNTSNRRRIYNLILKGIRFLASPAAIKQLISKITVLWKTGGLRLIVQRADQRIKGTVPSPLKVSDIKTINDQRSASILIDTFQYKPLISVAMPVYNTPPYYLDAAIKSVQAQYYSHWELCICDDGSTNPETIGLLRTINEPRVKVILLKRNAGISIATNQAVKHATGDFIAFLDHDDTLTPDALFEVVRSLNANPDLDIIYTDQDKLDGNNQLTEPFFKPDWSPDYFRAVMYVGHLLVIRRELFNHVNGLNQAFDGVQDFELVLRASEETSKIGHIPQILYHWRMIPGSVALGKNEKGEKIERLQVEAVNAHLQRIGLHAEAVRHPIYHHRVLIQPQPRTAHPKVSIIILTRDAPEHISRCLSSIFLRTSYPNFEVVVVDNGTTDPSALDVLQKHPIHLVPFHENFNYSRANNLGVQAANGEIVVLLNNDTEVLSPDWLEQMLLYLDDPHVAIVGPMLIYPNKTVQHAGVTLGMRGTADHMMRGFPWDSDGYAGSLSCPRNVAAVTGACLMMRRNDYLKAGGLIEYYGTHYQDVDLCLRFLSSGSRIVYVPYAVLTHFEGSTRGRDYDHLDRALLLDTWGSLISRGDPFYNPNFSLESPDYSVK